MAHSDGFGSVWQKGDLGINLVAVWICWGKVAEGSFSKVPDGKTSVSLHKMRLKRFKLDTGRIYISSTLLREAAKGVCSLHFLGLLET